jgi:mono/diheme cytochrome c family protein
MVSRMRELGLDPPQLAQWEAADLIAFLATVHYFDPPGDLEHGERLFREKRCVVCHQAGGLGGVVGPDLSVVAQHDSPLQIAAAMWNHGPSMVQAMQERGIERPGFTGSELIDLISYVESVSSASYQGPLFVVPGAADQGRTLYEQKGCARCHGIHGQGGGGAPSLSGRGRDQSLTQFAAAMWNKAPAMLRQMRSMGIQVPDLRADEMADIVAFLYTVRYFSEAGDPTVGRRQLQSKGCRRCHSLDGRGGTGAPDLAAARGLDTPEAVISAMWNHAVIPAEEGEEAQWPGLTPPEMANFVSFFQASPDAR